jgi:hypothetical protein
MAPRSRTVRFVAVGRAAEAVRTRRFWGAHGQGLYHKTILVTTYDYGLPTEPFVRQGRTS